MLSAGVRPGTAAVLWSAVSQCAIKGIPSHRFQISFTAPPKVKKNLKLNGIYSLCPRPCLVPKKFYKFFQILRHIESLDTYIKY